VQIPDLDAIAPGVSKITAEVRFHGEPILLGDLLADLIDLRVIPHHDAEMLDAIWAKLFHFEDGQELVLAQLAPGGSFAATEQLQIKHV